MEDKQIDRHLRQIGKAFFVKNFDLFKESFPSARSIDETAELLESREPGYAEASRKLRASCAKSIFKAGREKDALKKISASWRVPPDIADQASKLVEKL